MRTLRNGWYGAAMAVAIFLAAVGESQAQGNGPGGATLPFSNIYSRPTVSPYMQMQQQGMNPLQNQNVYQTMVQPQVQQQQQQLAQLAQARQITKMQNQVQQIQRDTSARQVDETIRPTGHASTYQNLSHFYPGRR